MLPQPGMTFPLFTLINPTHPSSLYSDMVSSVITSYNETVGPAFNYIGQTGLFISLDPHQILRHLCGGDPVFSTLYPLCSDASVNPVKN